MDNCQRAWPRREALIEAGGDANRVSESDVRSLNRATRSDALLLVTAFSSTKLLLRNGLDHIEKLEPKESVIHLVAKGGRQRDFTTSQR